MDDLNSFYKAYTKDLDSHVSKYTKAAQEARKHQDVEEYQAAQIKLGMLKMCRALFESRYSQLEELSS